MRRKVSELVRYLSRAGLLTAEAAGRLSRGALCSFFMRSSSLRVNFFSSELETLRSSILNASTT